MELLGDDSVLAGNCTIVGLCKFAISQLRTRAASCPVPALAATA